MTNQFLLFSQIRSASRPYVCSKSLLSTLANTIAAVMTLATISLINAAHADYNEIIVFGDNMSDTGNRAFVNNTYKTTTNERPYNKGRQSNGLLMVEHFANSKNISLIASRLEVESSGVAGTNFAMTGARAADVGPPGQRAHQLSRQVEKYLKRTPPDDNTLIVIAIGTNDVADTVQSPLEDAEERRELATEAIATAVSNLIFAKANRFVVANVANVEYQPQIQALIAALETEEARANLTLRARSDSSKFNQALSKKLDEVVTGANGLTPNDDTDDVELVVLDLFEYIEEILEPDNDPAGILREELGIENFQDACFRPNKPIGARYHADCDEEDENINTFAFFDSRQNTNTVHKYLAEKLEKVAPKARCDNCGGTTITIDPDLPLFSNGSALRMIIDNPNPNASDASGSSSGGSGSGGSASGSGSSSSDVVYINGVAGVVRWSAAGVSLEVARSNPRFDWNYVNEQDVYMGPMWYPL